MNLSYEDRVKKLKRYWKVKELKFTAVYTPVKRNGEYLRPRPGIDYCFFTQVRAVETDRSVTYPKIKDVKYDIRVSFRIKHNPELVAHQTYLITAKVAEKITLDNPFLLAIDSLNEIVQDQYTLPPEKFIEWWFHKKGENPGDAATIASQLKLNELELYTETERFIFELLQNADDMPEKNRSVNVDLAIVGDYFLFLHNGQFFSRDDVMSISDAAQSTKSKDKTKTGYKGIGFKSVFTDSSRVYIKSGDYFFKFDKLNPIYQDFWNLYEGYQNKMSNKARIEFRQEFQNRESQFTRIDRIPWQIKPIWVRKNEMPAQLEGTPFETFYNVAIALEIGQQKIIDKSYQQKVSLLLKEPRFLLFLRNIESLSFSYGNNNTLLKVERVRPLLNVYYDKKKVASYIKNEYEIQITNESFLEAGLQLQKRELQEGKYEFVDGSGSKVEDIPEKLSMLDSTVISFAAKTGEKGLESLDKEEAILFNYLPTSDNRFEFSFLVNGDFITNTGREFILHENIWNQYLLFQLGYYHLVWAEHLAEFRELNILSTYLNVVYNKFKDEGEDNSFRQINKSFNNGLRKGIAKCKFIINDRGNKVFCSETIIDKTKLSLTLGNHVFYKLFGDDKRLPRKEVVVKILEADVFNIEKVTNKTLGEKIKTPAGLRLFESCIQKANKERYVFFLIWLNLALQDKETAVIFKPILNSLAFIRFESKGELYHASWDDIKVEGSEFLLLNNKISSINDILSSLGFQKSTFNINDYSSIDSSLNKGDSYLEKDLSLFNVIKPTCSGNKLAVDQKIRLFKFFNKLVNVGPVKIREELEIFKNVNGETKPLFQLVDHSESINENWLESFKINSAEGEALNLIGEFTVTKKNIYSRIIANAVILEGIKSKISSETIASFYESIQKYFESDTTDDKQSLKDEDIIFISTEGGFKKLGELYFSKKLLEPPHNKNYSEIKGCIESLTGLVLPHKAALKFIKAQKFKITSSGISDEVRNSVSLGVDEARSFLEFLVDVERKEPLLKKGYFEEDLKEGLRYNCAEGFHQFSVDTKSDEAISNFIINSGNQSFKRLPESLLGVGKLHELGLLIAGNLDNAIIQDLEFDLSFIQIIKSKSPALQANWLDRISKFNLQSEVEYSKGSNEDEVLRIVIALAGDENNKAIVDSFRAKIFIDEIPLSKLAYKDKIRVKYIDTFYEFSLADVLPEYDGKSNVVDKVIQNFTGLKNLNKSIFQLETIDNREVFDCLKAIVRSKSSQYFFIVIYNAGKKSGLAFEGLTCEDLIDFAFKQSFLYDGYYPPLNLVQQTLPGYVPSNWVLSKEFAHGSEVEVAWLVNWLKQGDIAAKIDFLKIKHPNHEHVICLRENLKSGNVKDQNELDVAIANLKKQPVFLNNSLLWLFEKSSVNVITNEQAKIIYQVLDALPTADRELPIPVVVAVENETYKYELIKVAKDAIIYDKSSIGDDFKEKIQSHILEKDDYVLVDEMLPPKWKVKFGAIEVEITPDINHVILEKAFRYEEEPYDSWSLKENYPIHVLNGGIPYVRSFNEVALEEYEDGNIEKIGDVIYFNEAYEESLYTLLKEYIPIGELYDLQVSNKPKNKEDSSSTLEDKDTLSKEEEAALQRIFGDNVPQNYWKDLNLVSLIKGMAYLESEGWDVSEAEKRLLNNRYDSCLYPVKKDGLVRKVLCKSARSGILYLKVWNWEELSKEENMIFILTGKNYGDSKLCETKTELLDKYADYFVFRMEGKPDSSIVDGAISGKFDKLKMQILIRMKRIKSLKSIFQKVKDKERNDSYDNILVDNGKEEI